MQPPASFSYTQAKNNSSLKRQQILRRAPVSFRGNGSRNSQPNNRALPSTLATGAHFLDKRHPVNLVQR